MQALTHERSIVTMVFLAVYEVACTVVRADRCIAYSSNMHPCIPFQLGASQIAIHYDLPIALGVLPDIVHRGDVLQYTLTVEISLSMPGNTGGVAVTQSGRHRSPSSCVHA